MLEQVFAQLSSSPSPSLSFPFKSTDRMNSVQKCVEVGGPPGGGMSVRMRASHWGSLLELELLFHGEVVAGLVCGG